MTKNKKNKVNKRKENKQETTNSKIIKEARIEQSQELKRSNNRK